MKCVSTAELLRTTKANPASAAAVTAARPTAAASASTRVAPASSPITAVPVARTTTATTTPQQTTSRPSSAAQGSGLPTPRKPARKPVPQDVVDAPKPALNERAADDPQDETEQQDGDQDDDEDPDEEAEVDLASEGDEDAEDAECAVCGADGSDDAVPLLLCDGDGCAMALCITCTDPPLDSVPEGDWFCDQCVEEGNTKQVVVKADRVYRRMMEEPEDFDDDQEDQKQPPTLEEASTDDDDDGGGVGSGGAAGEPKKRKLVEKDDVGGVHMSMSSGELKRKIVERKNRRLDMGREALLQEKFSKYLSPEELAHFNWTAVPDSGAFGDWDAPPGRKTGPAPAARPPSVSKKSHA
jgi:hypothetical protein